MNNELWHEIVNFSFDDVPSEYGFTTRLANENYWTKDFTELAILEYKKFMYLAATSDFMVSPSEIIDVVWHQHLIFTQSYQNFCSLLGKQVQHIPSTHNRDDFEKFKQAKERTVKLYTNTFGEQPKSVWHFNSMYESLNLEKAKYKLRTGIITGILIFIVLIAPFYFLLRPLYVTIRNPGFGFIYSSLILATFIALEVFNRARLRKITTHFDATSFILNLHPFEVIYLKTQNLLNIVNGAINELVTNKTIQINSDETLELAKEGVTQSSEQQQTVITLTELKRTLYRPLLQRLLSKPVFLITASCMDAFKKYFNKSKQFANLFYLNFGILSMLLMCGFIRMITGILRDKPVVQITFVVIVLSASIIVYLYRLTKLVATNTIPKLYTREILPAKQVKDNWQWKYFLLGTHALTASFATLATRVTEPTTTGDSSGSSGSSCGSSCSSCGGCGGD